MATVYQRNGVFYAKYFDADGKRVSKNTGFSKKREAQRAAAKMEADALEQRRIASDKPKAFAVVIETAAREAASGDLTLARSEELIRRLRGIANPDFRQTNLNDWFEEWIEAQKPHVGDSTIRIYFDAKRRVTAALGSTKSYGPLDELKSDEIRTAILKISKKVKSSTTNMDLRVLRRVLEAACGEGLLTSNAAQSVRTLPTIDSVERAPFSAEEVRKLMDSAFSDEWRGLILIAAHTGLRLGDVILLSRENVEGSDVIIRPSKTARSRKTIRIPMTPPVMRWIGDKSGKFFPTLSQRSTSTHSTNFARLMEKAGVDRKVKLPGGVEASRSFHSLRHSFTSWLAEADVHSDIRRKLTGHSSAGVHDLYTHRDESLTRAIGELPNLQN
ncbi:tyrosine-type recombinase/integrase [Roseibacillus persicicus]|uniref:tyrosine-type recombinase/integrase n=1 Tax=Roseibacillus persicicus TaxID=454148 RepID=UPI00280E6E0D|nr:tyrosine-type recombinase/integrase [Roseibacillus persicicus]MDQ8191569.1 tyrosine-type recombinase/integrase [Roseibacillus persicicus]